MMAARELSAQETSSRKLRPVQINKQKPIGRPTATAANPEPVNQTGVQQQTSMSSQELAGQLAGAKDNYLLVENKQINGRVEVPADAQPLQVRVEFRNCEFTGDVIIKKANFDRSISLQNVKFDRTLNLDNVHIKGDLQLQDVEVDVDKLKLNQSQIDGDLRIGNPRVKGLQIEGLTAGNVIIGLGKNSVPSIDLRSLSTGRLSIASSSDSIPEVGELNLNNATLKDTLVLQNVTVQTLNAANLTVGKRTMFVLTTYIKKRLDLTSASLGNFEWRLPAAVPGAPVPLPAVVLLNGITFGNLEVAPVPPRVSSQSEEEETSRAEQERKLRANRRDYGVDFLQKASYFEAAYLAYEASLKTRGQSDAADGVYFAMRDRRRFTEWRDATGFLGKMTAGFNYVVGFGHKWLFGYGRSWTYPLVWCVLFVITGVFVFRAAERMEKVNEQAPYPFSAVWYSIDTFVPVLSLGVASGWRPKPEHRFLLFYAKFLSLTNRPGFSVGHGRGTDRHSQIAQSSLHLVPFLSDSQVTVTVALRMLGWEWELGTS
jgi:hypothetical protein